MKKRYFLATILTVATIGLFWASSASAATPIFSAFYQNNGDYVQVNISSADPNYPVILNYSSQMRSLGTTDSSGNYTVTISTSQYNITPGSIVYASVNGKNSNSLQWPYTSTSSSNYFYLTPSSLSLSSGQSSIVTASISGSFYLSSNSNPSVASASFNGSQITVTAGTVSGSTNMTICSTTNNANCQTLSINVSGYNSSGTLIFSQNNLSVPLGQTANISVSGGTGIYAVTNNTNPTAIQATISGSSISLYAGSIVGSATITVCSTNMSSCGTINASSVNSSNYSTLIFSQTNPTLSINQVSVITITGGIAPYSISSNSNSSVVQASISGNALTLTGVASGSSIISVCSSTNACSSVTVNVNTYSGTITFSQSSINISINQISNISIYGSGNYYVSSNNNPSVASAIINGSAISITGLSNGTDNIGVCSSNSQCGTLYITVSGSTTNNTNSSLTLTQVLSTGQGINLMLSGGSAPYSISSNSNSDVSSATINSGNILTLVGLKAGSSSITICSSGSSLCSTIPVMVVGGIQVSSYGNSNSSGNQNQNKYIFTQFIGYKSKGEEVTKLQEMLTKKGYYNGPVTGTFGDLTMEAVKKFQSENGISPVGYVGPSTRSALNK